MDELLGNFYILIPIAVVVVFRILAARKKTGEGDGPFSARLSPPRAGPDDAGEHVPPPGKQAGPVKPRPLPKPAPPAPEPHPVQAAAVPGPDFPRRLEYLPPLKRALALSEILGPPRGMA